MPRLSVWLVRAALIHLGIGLTLGALMLFHKGVPIHPAIWGLFPLHIEEVLVGWTIQLALGVAFWILPRFQGTWRRRAGLAWAAFMLLNGGVLFVAAGSLGGWIMVTFAGRLAELLAAGAFALHAWPRVKPPGA
ncbi:MAG: cbb3-type cytochrome c oxidase subunit I [Anaerolineae bacterium]